MKIILVTGGAGFVGSSFIKYFLKRNKNFIIVNVDKQIFSADMGRLADLENSPRYHHIKGDVCNRDLIEYVLRKYRPSWIVNFCSETQNSRDPKKFQAADETSYTSTLALLDGARHLWARSSLSDKRFLQVSTDEIYGTSNDEGCYYDEEGPLVPENPFTALKAGADLMALAYFKAFSLPAVILRSCSIYGPCQSPQCLIPFMIRNILANQKIELRYPGSEREWLHVADQCSAITRALFFARAGEIYNIGAGNAASEADIAARLLKLACKPADRLTVAMKPMNSEGHRRLNSYKARCNLKWTNSYTLDEGLLNTLQWYESNHVFTN